MMTITDFILNTHNIHSKKKIKIPNMIHHYQNPTRNKTMVLSNIANKN